MFKDFSQKSDLLERHIPVCLTPRVPPPPRAFRPYVVILLVHSDHMLFYWSILSPCRYSIGPLCPYVVMLLVHCVPMPLFHWYILSLCRNVIPLVHSVPMS